MNKREKLIQDLKKQHYLGINCDFEAIAVFIIKDRQRIVSPLIKRKGEKLNENTHATGHQGMYFESNI